MHRVLVLRTEPYAGDVEQLVAKIGRRWGLRLRPALHRLPDGGAFVEFTGPSDVKAQLRQEPQYPYPLLRLDGPDNLVAGLAEMMEPDLLSRQELLVEMAQRDPPEASLLVLLALVTEELDQTTVEIFVRALESSDREHRRQALTAISLVPALAFAPALILAQQRETDPTLRLVATRVLAMCEG